MDCLIVGFKKDGINYSFDHYVGLSLEGETEEPYGYIYSIAKDLKQGHAFPSPTVYGKCPRQVFFQRTNEYYVDPLSMYYLFSGTARHYILEQIDRPDALKELSVKIDTGEFNLTGRVDLVLPDLKQVRDYKTIKRIATDYGSNGEKIPLYLTKKEYCNQLSLYAIGLEQIGIPIEQAWLEYYSRDSNSPMLMAQIQIPLNKELAKKNTNNYLRGLFSALDSGKPPPIEKQYSWCCELYCDVNDICERTL